MTPHLTVEQKRAIHRLRGRGLSLRQVAREVGCTAPGVVTVLNAFLSSRLVQTSGGPVRAACSWPSARRSASVFWLAYR